MEEILKLKINFVQRLLGILSFIWVGLYFFSIVNSKIFTLASLFFGVIGFLFCIISYQKPNIPLCNKMFSWYIFSCFLFSYWTFYHNPSYGSMGLNLLFYGLCLTIPGERFNRHSYFVYASTLLGLVSLISLNKMHTIYIFGMLSTLVLGTFLIHSYYQAIRLVIKHQKDMEGKFVLEKSLLETTENIYKAQTFNVELFSPLIYFLNIKYISWNSLDGQIQEWGNSQTQGAQIKLKVYSKDQEELGELILIYNSKTQLEDNQLKALTQAISSFFTRKRAEEIAESSTKLSALGEIAAGIAHEINNPLAIVHGKATMIQLQLEAAKNENEPLDLKELEQNNTEVIDTIERIDKIVNSLRYFIRDDSKNPFIKTNLEEILDNVQVLSIDRCKKSGIVVSIDNKIDKNFMFECKPTQVSQILINLLNNSFDAISEEKGPKWINIAAKLEEDNVVLEVTDSGKGIPPEVGEKILKAFYTTKKHSKYSGSGLGLNIVKRIIEMHNGLIQIDYNSPNTKFVIKLPIQQVYNIKEGVNG